MDLIRLKKGFGSNEEARRSGIDWWTDHEMLEAFKLIIDKLTSRVNHLTGVRYADDPTILAWETGELLQPLKLPSSSPRAFINLSPPFSPLISQSPIGNEMCVNGMRPAPASWTLTVAA